MADTPLARLKALKVEQQQWPGWLVPALAGGPTIVAIVAFLDADVDRPAVFAGLLLLAVTPWLVEAVRGDHVDWPLCYLTAVAAAAITLAGEPLGVIQSDDHNDLVLLILAFAVGEAAATRTLWTAGGMTAAGVAIALLAGAIGIEYDAAAIWTAAMFIGLFVGLLMRRMLTTVADLAEAQDALAADAAARERQRIAREVHDVIAHSMTVTMLHVTAARLAVGRGDADAATDALEEAERLGRRSLTDIRSTVGLLRNGEGEAATAAALPLAADLDDLVAGYRAAGLPVDAAVDPAVADVPAAVGLAVYRIVQEALSNVAMHAPGAAATVRITVGDAVAIDVEDTGGPATVESGSPGHGVLGMRERAESLGGTLDAGPSERGWRVAARIPAGVAAEP